jgi:hypothetical protein
MLDDTTINALTKEARPVDYRMLRSYIKHAPSAEYARSVTIPSLRKLHPRIWTHVDSGCLKT